MWAESQRAPRCLHLGHSVLWKWPHSPALHPNKQANKNYIYVHIHLYAILILPFLDDEVLAGFLRICTISSLQPSIRELHVLLLMLLYKKVTGRAKHHQSELNIIYWLSRNSSFYYSWKHNLKKDFFLSVLVTVITT